MNRDLTIIKAFVDEKDGIKNLVNKQKNYLLQTYPKMSASEAMGVAAARINMAYREEIKQLHEQRRDGGEGTRLFNALVSDNKSMGEYLQDLTGTRTLLADETITDEYLKETFQ